MHPMDYSFLAQLTPMPDIEISPDFTYEIIGNALVTVPGNGAAIVGFADLIGPSTVRSIGPANAVLIQPDTTNSAIGVFWGYYGPSFYWAFDRATAVGENAWPHWLAINRAQVENLRFVTESGESDALLRCHFFVGNP